MTFWVLLKSVLLACLGVHPIVLSLMGFAVFVRDGKIEGLFAVAATPMTLAFFGIPTFSTGLFVIIPTYYAFSWFGRRAVAPFALFALGAGTLLHLFVTDPAPTGAMPGYDQTAQAFSAATLIVWSLYAHFRMELRQV